MNNITEKTYNDLKERYEKNQLEFREKEELAKASKELGKEEEAKIYIRDFFNQLFEELVPEPAKFGPVRFNKAKEYNVPDIVNKLHRRCVEYVEHEHKGKFHQYWYPREMIEAALPAYKDTKDDYFLKKMMPCFVIRGKYDKALYIAHKLNDQENINRIEKMIEITQN
ncbi:hypothetical protein ACFL1H_01685 [Nanoarchaeota archaeon]